MIISNFQFPIFNFQNIVDKKSLGIYDPKTFLSQF
jgi:hypothetical protein